MLTFFWWCVYGLNRQYGEQTKEAGSGGAWNGRRQGGGHHTEQGIRRLQLLSWEGEQRGRPEAAEQDDKRGVDKGESIKADDQMSLLDILLSHLLI